MADTVRVTVPFLPPVIVRVPGLAARVKSPVGANATIDSVRTFEVLPAKLVSPL